MFDVGAPELLIILAIIILLFGVGRISKIAGELGSGLRAFREGMRDPDEPARPGEADESRPGSNPE